MGTINRTHVCKLASSPAHFQFFSVVHQSKNLVTYYVTLKNQEWPWDEAIYTSPLIWKILLKFVLWL